MSLAAYVAEDGLVGHHWEERPLGIANFICPSTGKRNTIKQGKINSKKYQGQNIQLKLGWLQRTLKAGVLSRRLLGEKESWVKK